MINVRRAVADTLHGYYRVNGIYGAAYLKVRIPVDSRVTELMYKIAEGGIVGDDQRT